MPTKKSLLVCLYILVLCVMFGVTLVGPAIGNQINNLQITSTPVESLQVACKPTKSVNWGSLSGGTEVSTDSAGGYEVSLFDYDFGLYTDNSGLVKAIFDGACEAASTCTGSLAVDFSFGDSGESNPASVVLSLIGTSTNISGFFGILPTGSPGTDCSAYTDCIAFSNGAINTQESAIQVSNIPSTIVGRLYLSSLQGSLTIGTNSGDISLVPEPGSILFLTGGLAALWWLRRRIRSC